MPDRYVQPNWFTRNIFNRIVAWLASLGISLYGARILAVTGRKTGAWHTVPINLLEYRGERYLVAPRGTTHWVKNLRANPEGRLMVGRRTEPFDGVEVPDEEFLLAVLNSTPVIEKGNGPSSLRHAQR